MNRLTIILCVLMEAVLIIAKTERLSAIPKSNSNKFVKFTKYYSKPTGAPVTQPAFIKYYSKPTSTTVQPSVTIQPSNKLYSYSYNIDGIQAQEDGYLNHINTEQEALEARGSYNYTDAEGNTFQVSYVANENGFQPEGAHLLTASLIKKALKYIAEHPEKNGQQ